LCENLGLPQPTGNLRDLLVESAPLARPSLYENTRPAASEPALASYSTELNRGGRVWPSDKPGLARIYRCMKHIRTMNESWDYDRYLDPPDYGPDSEPYYGTELPEGERLFDAIAMSTSGGLLKRRGTNELWWMDLDGEEVREAMESLGYWPRWDDDEGTPLAFDEVDLTAFVDFATDLYRGNTRNLGKYNPSDFLGDGLKNWYPTTRDEAGRYVGQEEGEGGLKPIVKVDADLAEELIKEVGSWYLLSKPRSTKYQTNSASVNTTAYRKIVNALAKAYPPQKS